jgi:hypothetical protein
MKAWYMVKTKKKHTHFIWISPLSPLLSYFPGFNPAPGIAFSQHVSFTFHSVTVPQSFVVFHELGTFEE